jgi:predicted aspartyl protease
MGILVKQVTLRGDKGQVELDGMFDTGATYSVIRKDIAEQIATVIPLDEPIVLRDGGAGSAIDGDSQGRFDHLAQRLSPFR